MKSFSVWNCLVTSNESGQTDYFARAWLWCVWLTPHFLTLWYQPPPSSFQQMHHHRTCLISASSPSETPTPHCPRHLHFTAQPSSPATPQPLLIHWQNIHQPQTRLSTSASSLCGGFIFQMLQRSIQTPQTFLPYLTNTHHPHRQALILYWLIPDDWIWSCTLCQSKLQFIMILPSRHTLARMDARARQLWAVGEKELRNPPASIKNKKDSIWRAEKKKKVTVGLLTYPTAVSRWRASNDTWKARER